MSVFLTCADGKHSFAIRDPPVFVLKGPADTKFVKNTANTPPMSVTSIDVVGSGSEWRSNRKKRKLTLTWRGVHYDAGEVRILRPFRHWLKSYDIHENHMRLYLTFNDGARIAYYVKDGIVYPPAKYYHILDGDDVTWSILTPKGIEPMREMLCNLRAFAWEEGKGEVLKDGRLATVEEARELFEHLAGLLRM